VLSPIVIHDVEGLVEDVIRSINIGLSIRKLHGCILQSELPLFSLADCLIYAAINSVDVVEPSVLDGVQT
jgi:hypothetical protein